MVYLDCSGVRFGSQLDEKHLFEWAREISCVIRWEQDTLVVRSRRISEARYVTYSPSFGVTTFQ